MQGILGTAWPNGLSREMGPRGSNRHRHRNPFLLSLQRAHRWLGGGTGDGTGKDTKPQTSLQGNRAANPAFEAAGLGSVSVSGSLFSTEAGTFRAARPAPSSGPAPVAPSAQSAPPVGAAPPAPTAAPPARLPPSAGAANAGSLPARTHWRCSARRQYRPRSATSTSAMLAGRGRARQAGRQWLRRRGPGWAGGCVVGPAKGGRGGKRVRVRAIKWQIKNKTEKSRCSETGDRVGGVSRRLNTLGCPLWRPRGRPAAPRAGSTDGCALCSPGADGGAWGDGTEVEPGVLRDVSVNFCVVRVVKRWNSFLARRSVPQAWQRSGAVWVTPSVTCLSEPWSVDGLCRFLQTERVYDTLFKWLFPRNTNYQLPLWHCATHLTCFPYSEADSFLHNKHSCCAGNFCSLPFFKCFASRIIGVGKAP